MTFTVDKNKQIHCWTVLKRDVVAWLAAASVSLLLFLGTAALLGGADPDMDSVVINGYLSMVQPFMYGLIVLAVLLARRSLDKWTWIFAVILILFFTGPGLGFSFAQQLVPSSIVPAMIAMIGLLALSRIVEYGRLRYVIELREPRLTKSALITYVLLVVAAILLNSSLFYDLIMN